MVEEVTSHKVPRNKHGAEAGKRIPKLRNQMVRIMATREKNNAQKAENGMPNNDSSSLIEILQI